MELFRLACSEIEWRNLLFSLHANLIARNFQCTSDEIEWRNLLTISTWHTCGFMQTYVSVYASCNMYRARAEHATMRLSIQDIILYIYAQTDYLVSSRVENMSKKQSGVINYFFNTSMFSTLKIKTL